MNEAKKAKYEIKFEVLPKKYVHRLRPEQLVALNQIHCDISMMRIKDGKSPHAEYFVCNQDEPYADEVLRVILDGEDKKNEN